MPSLYTNVYICIHLYTNAQSYLVDKLCQVEVADVDARQRLRSVSSSSLIVGSTRLSTVGDRAFPVAAARIWITLSQHVTSAPPLLVFRSCLKMSSDFISGHVKLYWFIIFCGKSIEPLKKIHITQICILSLGLERYGEDQNLWPGGQF